MQESRQWSHRVLPERHVDDAVALGFGQRPEILDQELGLAGASWCEERQCTGGTLR